MLWTLLCFTEIDDKYQSWHQLTADSVTKSAITSSQSDINLRLNEVKLAITRNAFLVIQP